MNSYYGSSKESSSAEENPCSKKINPITGNPPCIYQWVEYPGFWFFLGTASFCYDHALQCDCVEPETEGEYDGEIRYELCKYVG